ncbi:phosphocarrier protein [Hydrogenoanaerobacterium saccharovorans]|uniref:Phosphocarrier protein n=1 Tax=Hydrogenoanaerobacterium saccharovorans TaxID=474960 RepID=A0A1H7ZAV0_9FIRM|nr:HPr family phosphocarrier protein [Hydrogenoanaerobacterium saccharovorans]RPF48723.1 phosphocarrier protein [Hydrogenoanaerobacterium saccharovorans]SEM55393.1 phosphocarrier protein [Hydrogenoanaerobacterium saccharovorans]
MKQFEYTVVDELGLHARPAGLLVKKAMAWNSKITIKKEDKTADAKRLFAVMSLAVKKGETIAFVVDGEDESDAAQDLQAFCSSNL